MKNVSDVSCFLADVLGKEPAKLFEANMDELLCVVRSEALNNENLNEASMKSRIKKMSESIIAASIKSYLDENYADDAGEIILNFANNCAYDKNMKPIIPVDRIQRSQKEMLKLMVAMGMFEYAKGRNIAMTLSKSSSPVPIGMPRTVVTPEEVEIKIIHLENKLPNLSAEEAAELISLYRVKNAGLRS